MDEGDMSGDDNQERSRENTENAKRPKIDTASAALITVGDMRDDNTVEVSREQMCTSQEASSSTSCILFNSVRRNSIKKRNYRKSGEAESNSDVEER